MTHDEGLKRHVQNIFQTDVANRKPLEADQAQPNTKTDIRMAALEQERRFNEKFEFNWVAATLEKIPDWRAEARCAYLSWVVTDRALGVAKSGCSEMAGTFDIAGIRAVGDGFARKPLASWARRRAEHEHSQAAVMAARFAMVELVGVIEESLFGAYELFLSQNLYLVIDKPQNNGLKRLHARRFDKPEAWTKSWNIHMRKWRHDLKFQGSENLVGTYWYQAKLTLPERYRDTDIVHLGATIGLFLELCSHILRRATQVDAALARASIAVGSPDFDYSKGKPFRVEARQVELVEAFYFEYLEALGMALEER